MKSEESGKGGVGRRDFLKMGSGGLALSMTALQGCASPNFLNAVLSGEKEIEYTAWDDVYRKEWAWDSVTWGSHNNQCLPASCSFRVYSKNGVVWREEQSAKSGAAGPEYPDYNPMGCQKGCAFHHLLYSPERLRYPMKRIGERGEGKWQRITWDEALTEVADAILDGHEKSGPHSFVIDAPHVHAGAVATAAVYRMSYILSAISPDVNVAIGDDLKGISQTVGKMRIGDTADNMFDAEMAVFTHTNWAYTAPPMYHFITEARYNGTEIVLLAPDFNASAVSADVHIPVKPASDAAFWLAVSQVILDEGLMDHEFVREQTDLALLVRTDNAKYLRATDIDGGRRDQLYFFDEQSNEIVAAPRGTLAFDGTQALEGTWEATLSDGKTVRVEPVLARLKRMLDKSYRPEVVQGACGVTAKSIRTFARKVAAKRTHLYIGFSSAKQYHGDLMERAALMAMGLTGNWGKPGTGFNNFIFFQDHLEFMMVMEDRVQDGGLNLISGFEHQFEQAVKEKDPEATHEEVVIELTKALSKFVGFVPPTIWMYNHAGYNKLWDKKEWADPDLKKTFGEYLSEGLANGSIEPSHVMVPPEQEPQVLMYMAHNPFRRQRSGRNMYVEELFPKAKMIFSIETRMSSSAAFSDILLPAAWYYEKEDMTQGFGSNPFHCVQQKAVEPAGEARPEWEIHALLLKKIGERATARGMDTYTDRMGVHRTYTSAYERFTMNETLLNNEDVVDQFVRINEAVGIFPKDYTYDQFKEDGVTRITGLGIGVQGVAPASDWKTDKPFYSLGWHVDKKLPYPTMARRAQFYIEHDWFLEAGEEFPVYKDAPPIGGAHHEFRVISGHPRNSVHTLHSASPHFLKLHRGQPVVFINNEVAARKGIEDGDMVRIFNDVDSAEMMASISAAVGTDQVTTFMWEPFQFKNWKSPDAMLVGMPKGTALAMDYPQLRYYFSAGSPNPTSDRTIRVSLEKV